MATIPIRERLLATCVASIVEQLDHLHVYLNGYDRIPECLQHPRVSAYLSKSAIGDLGDVGKFFGASQQTGHFLTLDDDFVYPSDYVYKMRSAIQRFQGPCCVGVHGIRLANDVHSYLRNRTVIHWNSPLATDTPVHILGTGLMCFDASAVRFSLGDFGSRNMADLWFGVLAQLRKWPQICVKHGRGWLRSLEVRGSLFQQMCADDSAHTAVVNSIQKWQLWEPALARPLPQLPNCADRRCDNALVGHYRCTNSQVFIRDMLVDYDICSECTFRRSTVFREILGGAPHVSGNSDPRFP